MFKKSLAIGFFMALSMFTRASAVEVPIVGNVAAKCVIVPDTAGVYGNPTPDKLSTATADGGVQPVVRFDVLQANYFKAVISTPTAFSVSPALTDVVNWTGSVSTSKVSVAGMSAYDTNKVVYNNTSEFNLTIAGTTWFKASSTAEYGSDKALPSGTYRAVINAECIAL